MQKENFRILENGHEVPDYTLWCPDPTFRCAGSFVFVADASGSMHGAGMEEMRRDLKSMTGMMDGVVDQAALIAAGRDARTMQFMTEEKLLLLAAIDSLRASGASALYDGVMEGVSHLIGNGINSCRALIVFSDGWDNISVTTTAEIIALANRHRIRIFTVGVGFFVNTAPLEMLALYTGGRSFRNPDAEQLEALYREITTGAIGSFIECVITYERDCADGSERTIELQLNNFCGGGGAKTKTYRAPLDSSRVSTQRLRIGHIVSTPGAFVTVPLLLDGISRENLLRPFDITIYSASAGSPLVDVVLPAGSPLSGAALIVNRYSDSVRLQLNAAVSAGAGVTLLEMQFSTAGIQDSVWVPLRTRIQDVDALCAKTEVEPGGYHIVPRLLPRITPEGTIMICPRGTVALTANEGFVDYRWSTGDTTRGISVSREGPYYVDVIDGAGTTLRSDTVYVQRRAERNVRIASSGPLTFCNGGSVTLSVAGDTVSTQRYWHNSHNPEETFIARNSGSYWASVLDEHGCRHYTDTVVVTEFDPPLTLNIGGNHVYICPGDSIELRVVEDYPHYYWQRAGDVVDSTRGIMATVNGGVMSGGKYNVRVRTADGCEGNWYSVYVLPRTLITPTLFPKRVV
ncbi:MAG: VWA domain-containing protein, partial [Bacteroidetes bacterium]|nr:VWA domain-containing protein [Bacteroidota bacterium]